MDPQQASAARARIRVIQQEMAGLVETLLTRRPLLKGCVYLSRRRCGKPGCACAKGPPHTSTVLAYRGEARQRNLYPSPGETPALERMCADYQRLRRCRVELGKLYRRLREQIDVLEEAGVRQGERRLRNMEIGRKLE